MKTLTGKTYVEYTSKKENNFESHKAGITDWKVTLKGDSNQVGSSLCY